jgi:protocatechuate 3,4-dioxygenase beta subunit
MSKDRPETPHAIASNRVERRQALRGLGALAAMVSGCSSNMGSPAGSGGSSAGGSGAFGGSNSSGGSFSSGGSTSRGGASGSTGGSDAGSAAGGAAGEAMDGAANPGDAQTADAMASADAQLEAGGPDLIVPPWDTVPTCTAVSATDGAGQGPFFIHEKEKNDDVSLYREDIRGRYDMSAAPGVEMQLHFRVLSKASLNCGMPIVVPNVDVYIWHTDAQGFYSGFGTRGGADEQKPDDPYTGVPSTTNLDTSERFCRGVQTTDRDGVVSFRTIFPGWYNGRVLHIHFVAFKPGSSSWLYLKPSGKAVDAGCQSSATAQCITGVMPPSSGGPTLTAQELQTLRQWILDGAAGPP